MGYLSGVRFQAEVDETILSLREVRLSFSFSFFPVAPFPSLFLLKEGFRANSLTDQHPLPLLSPTGTLHRPLLDPRLALPPQLHRPLRRLRPPFPSRQRLFLRSRPLRPSRAFVREESCVGDGLWVGREGG
jgi:hypothetical protein